MNTLKDFIHRISYYSDKELMSASIYDAALFTESEIGLGILTDRIMDELIERDLPVVSVIRSRKLIDELCKRSPERRNRLLSELRAMASSSPITWAAPTYDDLMAISANLNDYESEGFDLGRALATDPMLPVDYYWSQDGGLIHMKEDGTTETVYPGKIGIRRILVDGNNDPDIPQKAEISFECDGQEKIRKLTLKDLFNGTAVQYLANYGALVNDSNSKLIAKYFFDYMATFRSSVDISYTTQQIGWLGNKFDEFVPHVSNSEYDCSEYRTEYKSILHSMGHYREWASLVNQFRDNDHIPFRIILATSFASVLAEPLMHQPFFLYIQGRSQVGKTPSLMVVASVWANPENRSGYVKDLAGSDEALELGAQFYGSLPYCLNESQNRVAQEKNPSIDRLVYLLGDGTPKTRGKGTGGLRSQSSWCNAIILTGEEELTSKSDKLGVRMRVLDLNVDTSIISSDDKETETLCGALSFQYNTAGPEFIKKLIQDGGMDEACSLYDEFRKLIPQKVERRQGHIAATILTADTLISKWIFEDSIRLTVEDILPYLKVKPNDEDQKRLFHAEIHEEVIQWIQDQISTNGKNETEYGKVKAKKGKSPAAYVFRKGVLERIVEEAGGELFAYLDWVKQNNLLATGAGHPYESLQSFSDDGDKRQWYYTIYLPSTLQ